MEGQMATRKVKLTGTAEWAKVFAENRDLKGFEGAYEAHDGACTIDLIMDEANVAALKASRSIKNPKDVGNGLFKTKFVRKFDTGRDWDSGAPNVTNADGDPWSGDLPRRPAALRRHHAGDPQPAPRRPGAGPQRAHPAAQARAIARRSRRSDGHLAKRLRRLRRPIFES